jgi:D-glycero-alpha-D-manno-heptose 1-phosphate guanylyltransferase
MDCIVLSGGFGTRLSHLLDNKPKTLASINDRPFLIYLLNYLKKYNINKYVFSLGYLSNQIIDFLDSLESFKYEFVIDPIPLGTGGAIRLAIEKCNDNEVLIINADTFFNVNLENMLFFHFKKKSDCTIALKPLENYDRYGTVEINENLKIKKFEEKKFTNKGLINGGFLILNKNVFINKFILNNPFSFEKDFLEKYLNEIKAYGFIADEYFIDIGIPEDYYKANIDFKLF